MVGRPCRFWGFAQMVIYRRIADHYQSAARFSAEIPAAPSVFESDPLEDSDQPQLQAAVSRRLAACSDSPCLSEEIDAANLTLARYGFDFFSLVSCSPKAEKTKAACAAAVNCLLDTPALLAEMRLGKTLPAKSIEKISGVPRNFLDRHRRYIIAAAEILSGEYPGIARYLRYIGEGKDR
jgi:RNA polymerase sigma factor